MAELIPGSSNQWMCYSWSLQRCSVNKFPFPVNLMEMVKGSLTKGNELLLLCISAFNRLSY